MKTETQPLLDLAGYQDALPSQPLPFPANPEYLVPSIVGHVGALLSIHSEGAASARVLAPSKAAVYKDLAARVAILLRGLGVTRLQPVYPSRPGTGDPLLQLLTAATGVYRNHLQVSPASETDEWLIDSAENLWRTLRGNCEALTGQPFQDVLHASLKTGAQR